LDIETAAYCVLIALAIYAGLALIGAPLWLLLRPLPLSGELASPLLGLAILQVWAWYWLDRDWGGMQVGLPVLLAFATVASVWMLLRTRPRLPTINEAVPTFGLAGAVAVAFVVQFRVPFRAGAAAASILNADIAFYVNQAGGLVAHGFGYAGNIAGSDLGVLATNGYGIGPGVYSTLAAAAAGTGLGVWRVALPVLLVMVVLGALAVRDAARLLLSNPIGPAVVALLVTVASLFVYVVTNYFLAQALAMPLVIAELLTLRAIARSESLKGALRYGTVFLALVVIAMMSYSLMAFAMQPALLGIIAVSEVGRGWLRRVTMAVAAVFGAFVVTLALVPVPFSRAIDLLHASFLGKNGWPLGLMTPLELLGVRPALRHPHPVAGRFMIEAIVVGALILGAMHVLRKRDAGLFGCAALMVLASYGIVYLSLGYSYEQWKWIAFFQPLLIASTFTLVAAGVAVVMRRVPNLPDRAPLIAGSLAGLALVALSARTTVVQTRHTYHYWSQDESLPWSVVDRSLSGLADNSMLQDMGEINVQLPQWEGMWAAYFLAPKTVHLLTPSYYPTSAAVATATIVRNDSPEAARPGARVLNDHYTLIPKQTK
jgi:hypothetical protein